MNATRSDRAVTTVADGRTLSVLGRALCAPFARYDTDRARHNAVDVYLSRTYGLS